MESYIGINEALIGLSEKILKEGVWRDTPGFQSETAPRCLEFPYPMTIEIRNPRARIVKIKERKWNNILSFAESLWLGLGWNDLDCLPGKYVKNLYNYSDDGVTWRAGYGPRIRNYTGESSQYFCSPISPKHVEGVERVDQLEYVIDLLQKDPYTRQALITIHDPMKDSRIGLKTKDQPCTRSIHFMLSHEGRLNCYVTMRSNDLIYGFSAVNVFNFTFMQEYIAGVLGVPVGRYYHIAHNLHVYENSLPLVKKIAQYDRGEGYEMDKRIHTDYGLIGDSFIYTTSTSKLYLEFLEVRGHEQLSYGGEESGLESLLEAFDARSVDLFFLRWAMAFYYRNMKDSVMKVLENPDYALLIPDAVL